MLANNNGKVVNRLAGNMIRTNRRQFIVLYITVALSALMIFSVFTVGSTYLDMSKLQNTRLFGSEFDIAVMNGFTERQKETLKNNPEIKTVGIQGYCGCIKSTEADNTADAGLLFADREFWEIQKAPARSEMDGYYPQEENEILATKKVLEACGEESLSAGDRISMTYEDNTGVHTREFLISGIWSGYGTDTTNFYVSEKFYNSSGYNLESDGILQAKFKSDYVMKSTIEKLKESLSLSGRQIFQSSDYVDQSITILMAVCGLCLVICFSAYLLIYNILYLSVSGKIRYYGLLKSLGMTRKQIVKLIRKQMSFVGAGGIVTGVLLGIVASLVFIPYVMEVLGISLGKTGMHFYPAVLSISILTTSLAIICGIRTPIHIAEDITPVEAVKYRVNDLLHIPSREKRGNLYWHMAKDQLKKEKKKTVVVFLSLATSLIVFYCLTTVIASQGERTVYPNYWDADLVVLNTTQQADEMSSIKPAVDKQFVSDAENIAGVKEVHYVSVTPVVIPYDAKGFSDFWTKGLTEMKPYMSYDETVSDYIRNPEKYYGMVKGIDENEFDYLNETLGNTVDNQDFLEGKTAILQYAGFEIPEGITDSTVSFAIGNELHEIGIGAVNYGDYYGASENFGANLIISREYLNTLTEEPYILGLTVKYGESYDEKTETEMKKLLDDSPYKNDLSYVSKYDEMKVIQESQGSMFEIGAVIALLLLIVGMLNYINTMSGSIQNRKLTFSIMESVGMSKKQAVRMLIREGLLYASGSILITLTVGTVITYIVFQSMNYMKIPFDVPVFPIICAVLLVVALCIVTPVVSYRRMTGNRSISERIREYE